jgi:type I restriction enzyme S subunit
LKQFPVPAPPRPEQEAIVAQIQATSHAQARLQASIDQAHSRARALRRSILAAAFSGQLVPQDLDDEPASVLLDRLREDRETMTPKKRMRKARVT